MATDAQIDALLDFILTLLPQNRELVRTRIGQLIDLLSTAEKKAVKDAMDADKLNILKDRRDKLQAFIDTIEGS